MDGSTSNREEEEEEEEELIHRNVAILGAATAAVEIWRNQMTTAVAYYEMLRNPLEKEDRKRERELYISTLMRGQEAHCISQLRMNNDCFDLLCSNLRNRGLLQDTRGVKVEEQVVLFLHTVAHNVRNITNAVRFFSNSDDVPIRVDDLECDSKGGGTSGESSLKKKEVRKRARDVEVLVMGMKESATLVQHALDNLADSIKNLEPHKQIGDEVYRELMKIEGLTRDDIDVTHEWLTLRKEMAAVFLSHRDKKEWILRRLHRIHAASFP